MKYWGHLNINRLLLFVFVRQFFFNYKTVHNIYSHLIHPERIAADQQDNLITGTTAPPINIISLWNNGTPKGPKNLSRLLCSPHFVTRLAKAIDLWHVFFPCIMCQETGLWNGEHDRTLVNMQHDINSSSSAASAGNYTNNTCHEEVKKSIMSYFITFIYILFPFLQILSTKSRTTPCETRDIGVIAIPGCTHLRWWWVLQYGSPRPLSPYFRRSRRYYCPPNAVLLTLQTWPSCQGLVNTESSHFGSAQTPSS